jgi:uncharacterized protein YjbJ (UPF0337 family)
MEWDRIEGDWQHYKALVKERWAQIAAQDLDRIGGQRDQLASHIGKVYGISREAAQLQVESWQAQQRDRRPWRT